MKEKKRRVWQKKAEKRNKERKRGEERGTDWQEG